MKSSASSAPEKFRLQQALSAATITAGIILMVFMMFVESEPGAVPLFLILSGSVWYYIIHRKGNNANEQRQ
jgi:hypothetical protein